MRTARPSRFLSAHAVTLGMISMAACGPDSKVSDAGRVAIAVRALSLPDVVAATYRVSLENGLGHELWTKTLTSSDYGDGAGSLAYVGPCDASAPTTSIALTLVELRDASGVLTDGVDYVNPAPATNPITLTRTCVAQSDVPVTFDLTVARAAHQGFFDVAVTFDDIFCSAKLDCESAPGVPLTLLHDAAGERALTAVVGFACTAGPSAATHLWMDRFVVTCEHGGPFNVDVADGPGNLDPLFDEPSRDLLYQAAIFRGSEVLQGWNKAYWNVALGLNAEAFTTLGACRLTGAASASDGPLASGVTPPDTRYPLVQWDVALTNSAGQRVCTTHTLDGGNGVATAYTSTSGHGFYAGLERATGLVTVTGATPDATSTISCTQSLLAVGESTTCTLVPKQLGVVIPTASGNFQLSAPSGTLSALTPSYGSAFTFTFTATTSATTPITTGVGVAWPLTITDTPDTSSTLTCDDSLLMIGIPTICTITPKREDQTIIARASFFTPSATAGTVTAPAPLVASAFTFTFTAPTTTGPVTISDGSSTFPITVIDEPDTTSTLTCDDAMLMVGIPTTCTITPMRSSAPITTRAPPLTPSTTAGTVTAPAPLIASAFTFTFTAPTTTGPVTISDGRHTFPITVYDVPDTTSTITCAPASIPGRAQSTCTITPKHASVAITAYATAFSPSTSAGSLSALDASLGTSFTLTLTAPVTIQTVTVSSGLSTTTVTITSTCSDGYQNGAETDLDCGGTCGPCATGKQCLAASDCTTSFCGADLHCADGCPLDPLKTTPGTCGCGVSDTASQRLGGTAANPARSCTDVLDQGQACGDRSYWIDPTGGPISDALEVYCDMTEDGGAWMKVESAAYPFFFDSSNWSALNKAAPTSANYSIVGDRSRFTEAGDCYELRFETGTSGDWTGAATKKTVWKQCHDPFSATTDGSDYRYISGDVSFTCAGFDGLHNKYTGNSYASDVDSNDSINCWWMQVVPTVRYQTYDGYLDGYANQRSHIWQSLWIRAQGRGKGREDPGTTCDTLHDEGFSDDGPYWLDTTGGDNGDAFLAYCDMTATAGWTRLEAAQYPFFFDASNYTSYQPTLVTAANYSLISRLAQLSSGGCTTYRIQVGETGTWQSAFDQETAWTQCHDPFSAATNGSDYTYISGQAPMTCGGFNGLHNAVQTFMYTSDADATDVAACWGMQTVPHTDYPGNNGYYDGYGGNHMHQWQTLWVR